MSDEQVVKLLNDLYTECESLKSKNKQLIRERNMKLNNALLNICNNNTFSFDELLEAMKQDEPSKKYQKMIRDKALELLGKEFDTE